MLLIDGESDYKISFTALQSAPDLTNGKILEQKILMIVHRSSELGVKLHSFKFI